MALFEVQLSGVMIDEPPDATPAEYTEYVEAATQSVAVYKLLDVYRDYWVESVTEITVRH